MSSPSQYVSNLTSSLRSLALGSNQQLQHQNRKDSLELRYKHYAFDSDIAYASNNELSKINSHLEEQEAAAAAAPRDPPPIALDLPVADANPEFFPIPAYSQTPIATPVQTPSVSSSYNTASISNGNINSNNNNSSSYNGSVTNRPQLNNALTSSNTNNPSAAAVASFSSNINSKRQPLHQQSPTKSSSAGLPPPAESEDKDSLLSNHETMGFYTPKSSLNSRSLNNLNDELNSSRGYSPHPADANKCQLNANLSKFVKDNNKSNNNNNINNNNSNTGENLYAHAVAAAPIITAASEKMGSNNNKIINKNNIATVTDIEKEEAPPSSTVSSSNSQMSNDSSVDSHNNHVEESSITTPVHIKGIPTIDGVAAEDAKNGPTASVEQIAEPTSSSHISDKPELTPINSKIILAKPDAFASESAEQQQQQQQQSADGATASADADVAASLKDEQEAKSLEPVVGSTPSNNRDSIIGYKAKSRFKEKRLSAISFARNIINLSVYHDSDSERGNPLEEIENNYIASRNGTTESKELPATPATADFELNNNDFAIKPKSRSVSKQAFNNKVKVRSKSLLRKGNNTAEKTDGRVGKDPYTCLAKNSSTTHKVKSNSSKTYQNPNLPSNFAVFVSKFIIPHCEVIASFKVLEEKEKVKELLKEKESTPASSSVEEHLSPAKSSNAFDYKTDANVYIVGQNDSTDQLITNGIHKQPSKNSQGSIKRSTSFLKKNGLRFLKSDSEGGLSKKFGYKKSRSSPSILDASLNKASLPSLDGGAAFDIEQEVNVNDKKYTKDIFKLETEDLLKMLKYWNYDYTLPEVKDLFPYLHNMELNNNQFNFFRHDLNMNCNTQMTRQSTESQNFQSKTLADEVTMHRQDYRISGQSSLNGINGIGMGDNNNTNNTTFTNGVPDVSNSSLSKLIPLPNADKYLLLINTNDFYEYDDSKDVKDSELNDDENDVDGFLSYIRCKYYLKGSINPWEILDFDSINNKTGDHLPAEITKSNSTSKKKDLKVRFNIEEASNNNANELNGINANSVNINSNNNKLSNRVLSEIIDGEEAAGKSICSSYAADEYDDSYKGYKFVNLNDEDLIINHRKFTGYLKPLNSLRRMNRIKNSDNGEGNSVLAHNLYNRKINLRNYNFQKLLLFKISHVVIYNNDNNVAESLKFAKIFGSLQKKIYLQEEQKLVNLNLGTKRKFNEAHCFILNYDCKKVSEFDITYYNENENVILGLEPIVSPYSNSADGIANEAQTSPEPTSPYSTKFESVDVNYLKLKQKYNFHNKADLAKYLSTNPFLVPYSSSVLKNNLTNWNKNYLLHEKFENWLITSGTEIYRNIYIGNIIDYNNVISINKLREKKQDLLKEINNKNVDAETSLKLRGKLLSLQQKIDANHNSTSNNNNSQNDYRILINCKEGVEFPKLELINSIFAKLKKLLTKETDLIYLEFPSAGSFMLSSLTNNHMLSIINFLKLLHFLSVEKNFKVLIYCYDGFTHLSFLSLLIETYNNFTNLNNAIMKYYVIYERYLYWFKIDYEMINFLQSFMLFYSPNNPDKQKLGLANLAPNETVKSLDYTKIKQWYEDVYSSLYNLNCYEFLKIFEMNKGLKHTKNISVVNDLFKIDRQTALTLKTKKDDWFDVANDNNLPSRILPYLYLGGISHLNSKTVLELLNINYVITIGEKPTWLNVSDFENQFDYEALDPALKTKLRKDDIIEINNPLPFLKKIIYLPNVQDNGIDPFEPYFLYLLKVIRKLREANQVSAPSAATNGNSNDALDAKVESNDNNGKSSPEELILRNKVLVNCKVGVSRSASLCIAEVMNFLKISLPRAYLYVRVRRLNLIIQPNLKIFYNLLELEEVLTIKENIKIKYINQKIEEYNTKNKLKKNNKKEVSLRKYRVLREVDWHILCKEIDLLNSHYIKN